MHRKLFALFLVLLITFLPLAGCKKSEPEEPEPEIPVAQQPDTPAVTENPEPEAIDDDAHSLQKTPIRQRSFNDPRFTKADAILKAMNLPLYNNSFLDANDGRILYVVHDNDTYQGRIFDCETMQYTVVFNQQKPERNLYDYEGRVFATHAILVETLGSHPPIETRVYLYRDAKLTLIYDRAKHSEIDNIEVMTGHYTNNQTLLMLGEDLITGAGNYYSMRHYVAVGEDGILHSVCSTKETSYFNPDLSERAYGGNRVSGSEFKIFRERNGQVIELRYTSVFESYDWTNMLYIGDYLIIEPVTFGFTGVSYNLVAPDNTITIQRIDIEEYMPRACKSGTNLFWGCRSGGEPAYYANPSTRGQPRTVDISPCFTALANQWTDNCSFTYFAFDGGYFLIESVAQEAVIFRP